MVNTIGIASGLGYINIPEHTLIETDNISNYPDNKTVIITTGSQGESMAALSRMANGSHKKVSIKPDDVIIFSSHPIPGNEKAVSKVMNELTMKGASIVFQDVHVSGHACQEEIKLLYSLVKPKYAVPVHGEFKHRKANAMIAESLDIPKKNIFIIQAGDVLAMDENGCEVVDTVTSGSIFVDGLGVGDVGNIVMRDRWRLSEEGIVIVVLTLDKNTGTVLAGPDLVSRGFVYVRESEDLIDEVRELADEAIQNDVNNNVKDWNKIKSDIRDTVSSIIWKRTRRSPMIIPIIMEVEV